jgi:hypothetical protein
MLHVPHQGGLCCSASVRPLLFFNQKDENLKSRKAEKTKTENRSLGLAAHLGWARPPGRSPPRSGRDPSLYPRGPGWRRRAGGRLRYRQRGVFPVRRWQSVGAVGVAGAAAVAKEAVAWPS